MDLPPLNVDLSADADAADALAAQTIKDGAARIGGAFAAGWNAGGLDQWLKSRQPPKTEQPSKTEAPKTEPSPSSSGSSTK